MSVEEQLAHHLAAEAAGVRPVPDLLDRVKQQRANRARRLQVVSAVTAVLVVVAGVWLAIVHGGSSATTGSRVDPSSSSHTLPSAPTVADTLQYRVARPPHSPFPSGGGVLTPTASLSAPDQISMPWAITAPEESARLDVVWATGDGYCVTPAGFHVTETATSVEVWAISHRDPAQHSCPADIRIVSSVISLEGPLGDRVLLHPPVDSNWDFPALLDMFGSPTPRLSNSGSATTTHCIVDQVKSYIRLSDLADASTAVVVATATGEVEHAPADSEGTSGLVSTVTTLNVTATLAGASPGSKVALRLLECAGPTLVPGRSYVLFVVPFSFEDGDHTGQYVLADGDTIYEERGGALTYVGTNSTELPKRLTIEELKDDLTGPTLTQ